MKLELEEVGGEIITPAARDVMIEAESQRAVAEVQAAMAIAKRFPRDQIRAMDKILAACMRPGLAEAALYQYSRGGTDITGPSIRLAEAIAQHWGNLQFGVRELERKHGESTVETYAWDMETNVRQTKTFQVPHIRDTKKGSYKLEDNRDIYEAVANQSARRLRACVLGVIPGDVIEAAVRQCELTLKTKADVTPERIQNLVNRFAEYGITKQQIETRIQRRIDAITPALVVNLGKIYNSLKDGMSVAADWFAPDPNTQPAPTKSTADNLKQKLKKTSQPIETPSIAEPPPSDNIACPDGGTATPDKCMHHCGKAKDCQPFQAWVKANES